MRRSVSIVALLVTVGIAPIGAQLAITSRVTAFDPIARTYFVASSLEGAGLKALSLTPDIKTKPEGEETLLGRRAAGTRTEIAIKLPEDPEAYRTYHDSMLGRAVKLDDTSRVQSGSGLPGSSIPATMNMWLQLSRVPRDLKIVVRTWETTEFGADGLSAARTGALAEMSRTFGLATAGLPLRKIVQTMVRPTINLYPK